MRTLWSEIWRSPRRAVRDLVWLGLGALIVSLAGFILDFSGRLYAMFVSLGAGRGEVGFVLGVLTVAFAIFGLRRWSDALHSQQRARDIFDHAAVGMFQSTPAGRFLRVNAAFARALGYDSPTELIAALSDISQQLYIDPSARAAFLQTLSEHGVAREIQHQVYRKDRAKIWVEISARAVRDARGVMTYIEGTLQDVTARKETEDAYRQLVDQSLQGILIVQNARFVLANRAASEIFGLSVNQLTALSLEGLAKLVHPDDRAQVQMRIRARLQGENIPSRYIFQVVRGSGVTRWVEIAANRIEYRGAPAVLAVIADVTERKRAQDEMQENLQRTQLREELSTALARAGSDLNATVSTFARTVGGAIGQSCTVMLVSADGKFLETAAYYHPNPRLANRMLALLQATPIPLPGHLFANAIESGQPLLFDQVGAADLEQLGAGLWARTLKHFRPFSLLLMPLRAPARAIGIVALARHLPEPAFQLNDQFLLQELTDRAVLAIANARLVQQLHAELLARRAAQEKYRTLVEQIPAITYITSFEQAGETLFISPQVRAVLGFTPDEWVATRDVWIQQLHPDDRDWVIQEAIRARASGEPFHAEYRLLARDASVHWVRDEATFVLDEARRPLYQHGIMLDITSYKTLEAKYARAIETADAERVALMQLPGSSPSPSPSLSTNGAGRSLPDRGLERDVTNAIPQVRAPENAEASAREQRAFAQALGEAAALLNRATNTEQVLDGILDVVARIVPYDTASIFLREGNVLRLTRARGFEKYGLAGWIQNFTFPVEIENFQMLDRERAPIVIADAHTYPGWVHVPETQWIRSNVGAPLRRGDETVGMLGLDSGVPNFYHAEHGARLMAFADLAAAALRNAHLMDEARRRADAFQVLSEITRDLAIHTEAPPLLDTIVERAVLLMHCPVGYLYTHDPKSHTLTMVVCRGMDLPVGYTLALGEGLVGQVALTQKAIYANAYDTYAHRVDNNASRDISAALGVPILYGGELIGVLGVAERQGGKFDENSLSLLSLFAGHVASVLATSRLLDETRLRAKQLALLYDVGLTMNRVLDSRTQLEFLFKIAQRALRADTIAYLRYDAPSETLIYELGIEVPPDVEQNLRARALSVRDSGSAVGWIANHRLPALIPLVKQDTRWHELGRALYSAVGVPVEHENELRGVLVAGRQKTESFSALDERLLILFANQVAAAMELSRLFQAQVQRQHELEILREASLAFAAAPDRDALTTLILQFSLRLVTALNAFLFFHHNDQLEFGGMIWSENSPIQPEPFAPRPDGLTHTVARTGEVIVIDDVNSHPMFSNWRWGGAIVGLPLKGEGQVRAVLNVAHPQVHRFTPEELRALGLLADQAAAALENARHMEETRRQLRIAQLLYQAGEELNRNLSFQETLERLADFFMQAIAVQMCCISRINSTGDEIEILLDRDPLPDKRAAPGTRYPLSNFPYLLRVMESKHPLAVRLDQPNLDTATAQTMNDFHWHSLLALPLFSGENVIGLVELADQNKERDFTADEVRLVTSLAHQAATTLQNAQFLQQARAGAEQLERLNRLTRALNDATSLEEWCDLVEGEMTAAYSPDASFIASYHPETGTVEYHRLREHGVSLAPFRWRLAPGLTRQVVLTGQALRIDERENYPSLENPFQSSGSGATMRSLLIVPLQLTNRVHGLVSIQSVQPRAYTDRDQQLLCALADRIAPALERIQRAP